MPGSDRVCGDTANTIGTYQFGTRRCRTQCSILFYVAPPFPTKSGDQIEGLYKVRFLLPVSTNEKNIDSKTAKPTQRLEEPWRNVARMHQEWLY